MMCAGSLKVIAKAAFSFVVVYSVLYAFVVDLGRRKYGCFRGFTGWSSAKENVAYVLMVICVSAVPTVAEPGESQSSVLAGLTIPSFLLSFLFFLFLEEEKSLGHRGLRDFRDGLGVFGGRIGVGISSDSVGLSLSCSITSI